MSERSFWCKSSFDLGYLSPSSRNKECHDQSGLWMHFLLPSANFCSQISKFLLPPHQVTTRQGRFLISWLLATSSHVQPVLHQHCSTQVWRSHKTPARPKCLIWLAGCWKRSSPANLLEAMKGRQTSTALPLNRLRQVDLSGWLWRIDSHWTLKKECSRRLTWNFPHCKLHGFRDREFLSTFKLNIWPISKMESETSRNQLLLKYLALVGSNFGLLWPPGLKRAWNLSRTVCTTLGARMTPAEGKNLGNSAVEFQQPLLAKHESTPTRCTHHRFEWYTPRFHENTFPISISAFCQCIGVRGRWNTTKALKDLKSTQEYWSERISLEIRRKGLVPWTSTIRLIGPCEFLWFPG